MYWLLAGGLVLGYFIWESKASTPPVIPDTPDPMSYQVPNGPWVFTNGTDNITIDIGGTVPPGYHPTDEGQWTYSWVKPDGSSQTVVLGPRSTWNWTLTLVSVERGY